MSVAAAARAKGITEVLHYTSEKGVMGSIIVGSLLSRGEVETTEDVAYIYEGVWDRARDIEWIHHISMSITKVNVDLFRRSRDNHPHWWWAIMAFPPEILDDENTVFTTTNNAYVDTCLRGQGIDGFDAMFAQSVPWGYYGSVATRWATHAGNLTTHNAAEVLYPRAIPLESVQAVYLPDEQQRSLINAWCEIYGRPRLPLVIAPHLF